MKNKLHFAFLIILAFSMAINAQTSTITYQGRLTDNSIAANGSYEMSFSLFNAASGGTQIGPTINLTNVQVTNGIFTVGLDFGTDSFPFGQNRFLQIQIRRNSGEVFTPLTPRQQVTTTPYSIRSLVSNTADNSTQLGGIAFNQYVLTSDSRLSDARTPTAGSGNYIQNRTSTQTSSNFDISGTGEASVFNARTQFSLNQSRILSSPGTNNTFVGIGNGTDLTTGFGNTFVGRNTGPNTTTGDRNTFTGSGAGFENISGSDNSFFGFNSGLRVISGTQNSMFGVSAGSANLVGINNSFFGFEAGLNTTNSGNTFIGNNSGVTNVTGNNNTLIGNNTDVSSSLTFYSTAVGAGAIARFTNTVQLGRDNVDVISIGRLPNYSQNLCVSDTNNVPGRCVSSIRYKKDVTDFRQGIELLRKLRPVSFRWKDTEFLDLGLIAEEVGEVEPLLTTTGKDGEIQGVKYDRLGVLLINVVNDQQTQIELQAAENKQLETKIDTLENDLDEQKRLVENMRLLVCADKPEAEICRIEREKKDDEK